MEINKHEKSESPIIFEKSSDEKNGIIFDVEIKRLEWNSKGEVGMTKVKLGFVYGILYKWAFSSGKMDGN